MQAILIINGWRKSADIDEGCTRRGYVYAAVDPPISHMIRPEDVRKTDVSTVSVLLRYTGCNSRNIPVFEYK